MNRRDWSNPVPAGEANARANGRKRHNAVKALIANERRAKLAEIIMERGGIKHGLLAQLAEEFGVSRATVTRDVQQLLADARTAHNHRTFCPICGEALPENLSEARQRQVLRAWNDLERRARKLNRKADNELT